jgi:hypothetical protein
VCDGKEKAALSLSFAAAAAALEEPLLSIPPADDGCDDQDEERSDGSNSLSNAGTEMNDISLIPFLFSRLPQEFLTLLYSQRISVSVSLCGCLPRFSLGFFRYIHSLFVSSQSSFFLSFLSFTFFLTVFRTKNESAPSLQRLFC